MKLSASHNIENIAIWCSQHHWHTYFSQLMAICLSPSLYLALPLVTVYRKVTGLASIGLKIWFFLTSVYGSPWLTFGVVQDIFSDCLQVHSDCSMPILVLLLNSHIITSTFHYNNLENMMHSIKTLEASIIIFNILLEILHLLFLFCHT